MTSNPPQTRRGRNRRCYGPGARIITPSQHTGMYGLYIYIYPGLFRAVAVAALTALAGCADEDEPSVCAIDGGVTRCALPE